jgi:uncharacterized membrane protein
MDAKSIIIRSGAGLLFIAMVTMNYLANSLPINNQTTGDISDAYPNLFTPAGLTFSIWGLIYLLLAGFVIYQFTAFARRDDQKKELLLLKVDLLFAATSITNIAWIFTWHYDFIGISVILMFVLLLILIRIADILRSVQLSKWEKVWISLPFSVYFGWITVATIANITVFLVSVNWGAFGIPDFIWTSLVLLIGAGIGIIRMRKDRKPAYGFVLIWAYLGILLSHLSSSGFDGKFPVIIIMLIACMVILAFFIGRLLFKKSSHE